MAAVQHDQGGECRPAEAEHDDEAGEPVQEGLCAATGILKLGPAPDVGECQAVENDDGDADSVDGARERLMANAEGENGQRVEAGDEEEGKQPRD